MLEEGCERRGIGNVRLELTRDLPDLEEVERRHLTEFRYFPHQSQAMPHPFRERPLLERAPDAVIAFTRDPDTGNWTFSDRTIEGIRDFFLAVRDLPAKIGGTEAELSTSLALEAFVLKLAPDLAGRRFLGIALWKWLALLVIALAGVITDYTIRAVLRLVWHRFARRKGADVEKATLARAVRPFGLFGAGLVWLLGLRLLGLPDVALAALLVAVRAFLTLAGVWADYRIADLIGEFFAGRAAGTATKIDDLLIPLLRKTAKVFITAMGVVYIANALHVEIVPLLTGLGIGGLAFAFAAKDTIENFFGSVAVIVDRPFEVGDWVVIGDVEGTVETLGFRSTRVRTFYNSLITVPNATLVRANVDNYGRRQYRRYSTHIGIAYATPPDLIETFCEGIRELIRLHPYTRKDYFQVWLHKMGAHSLDILLYVFHRAPDWQTELRERHRLLLDILRLADRLGVEIAFPTQTINIRRDDTPIEPHPDNVTARNAESAALYKGRAAARDLTRDAPWHDHKPPPYDFHGELSVGSAGDG